MSLTTQFVTMLTMIGMGNWLGVSIDTYTRFFKRRRARLFVFLNDLLFWIMQGLLLFYVLFHVNEGEIRGYIFIAILCGYASYRALFQKPYKWTLEICIQAVIVAYRFILKIIYLVIVRPIRFIFRLIIGLAFGILSFCIMVLRFLWKTIRFFVKIILLPFKFCFIIIKKIFPSAWRRVIMEKTGYIKKKIQIVHNVIRRFVLKWKKRK